VDEIVIGLMNKDIRGALIDSYVAAENQKKLAPFRLQNIIEHVSTNGIVFQNNGIKFASCIRDFILSRQTQVFEIILERVKPIKISGTSFAEEKSQNLINTNSAGFYIPVIVVLITLALLFSTGILWEYCSAKMLVRKRAKELLIADVYENDLTLTQWRQGYKEDMTVTVKGIQEDIEMLKEKCLALSERLTSQGSGLVTSTNMFDLR